MMPGVIPLYHSKYHSIFLTSLIPHFLTNQKSQLLNKLDPLSISEYTHKSSQW